MQDDDVLAQWLVCRQCGRTEPVGSMIKREQDGWPRCCAETMYISADRGFTRALCEPRGDHERPDAD